MAAVTATLRSAVTLDLAALALVGIVVAPIGFGLLFAVLRLRRQRRTQRRVRRVMEG